MHGGVHMLQGLCQQGQQAQTISGNSSSQALEQTFAYTHGQSALLWRQAVVRRPAIPWLSEQPSLLQLGVCLGLLLCLSLGPQHCLCGRPRPQPAHEAGCIVPCRCTES